MAAVQKIFKLLGNTLFIVMMVLMIAVVAFMVKGKIDGGVPAVGPYQLYVVLSGSMNPTFDTGSLLAVEKVDPSAVKLKDIITFRSPEDENMIITHRVKGIMTLETGQVAYLTQGDANNAPDQNLIPKENLIGKAVCWVPCAGYVTEFAKTKKGILIMIVIPGILIIGSELWHLFRYAARYDEEEKRKQSLEAAQADNRS